MKSLRFAALVLITLASGPALAESANDAGGTGPVPGEGPGGSGAGQTSAGIEHPKMKLRHHSSNTARTPLGWRSSAR